MLLESIQIQKCYNRYIKNTFRCSWHLVKSQMSCLKHWTVMNAELLTNYREFRTHEMKVSVQDRNFLAAHTQHEEEVILHTSHSTKNQYSKISSSMSTQMPGIQCLVRRCSPSHTNKRNGKSQTSLLLQNWMGWGMPALYTLGSLICIFLNTHIEYYLPLPSRTVVN